MTLTIEVELVFGQQKPNRNMMHFDFMGITPAGRQAGRDPKIFRPGLTIIRGVYR